MPPTFYVSDKVNLKYLFLLCVYMHVSECTDVYHVCAGALRDHKRVPVAPELIDSCEPPGGCWEPNLDLLHEQGVC